MATQENTAERLIAEKAARSHGVVTRRELLNAGMSTDEIGRRARRGTLIRVYPGVYRVGHRAPGLEASYMAAVRACGGGSALAGLAAAHLFSLLRGRAPRPEVIAPTQRRVNWVKVRRTRCLDPRDLTIYRGIPTTTVPRTLVDVAANLNAEELARACHEAGVHHHTTPRQVETVLARRPNTPGAAKLRRIIRGDVKVTLSVLERRFLDLLEDHKLPLPTTNKPAGSKRVDCRWPEHRLTVELDSNRFHNSRHAWEADRRREREARARGDKFRSFTYGDVFEDPGFMLAELRDLLPP